MSLLKVGSTGQKVKDWQNFLNKEGYSSGTADGIFGPNTKSATQKFQSASSLAADGIVGANTVSAAEKLGFAWTTESASSQGSTTQGFPPANTINTIIDVSHHNGTSLDFEAAKAAGITGAIVKATQGVGYVDPNFKINRDKVKAAGLLYGAYHYGTGSDAAGQAQDFLEAVQPDKNTLIVIDYEKNPKGTQMTLELLRTFIETIKASVGRYPVLYCGHYLKGELNGQSDSLLASCPLWYAQYSNVSEPSIPPCWDTWAMWQYTDGEHGNTPYSTPGIGNSDKNLFQGDAGALNSFWAGNY